MTDAADSILSRAGLAGALTAQQISGELKQWHDVVLTFDGPSASETAEPNPFLDYRLNVTFTKGGRTYAVPGYFAADGNAGMAAKLVGAVFGASALQDAALVGSYLSLLDLSLIHISEPTRPY